MGRRDRGGLLFTCGLIGLRSSKLQLPISRPTVSVHLLSSTPQRPIEAAASQVKSEMFCCGSAVTPGPHCDSGRGNGLEKAIVLRRAKNKTKKMAGHRANGHQLHSETCVVDSWCGRLWPETPPTQSRLSLLALSDRGTKTLSLASCRID